MRHEARAYDRADHRADKADCGGRDKALADRRFHADHKRNDDKTHAEARSDVGQRRNLILFEIPLERIVVSKRQNRRIVREEAGKNADHGRTGQVINGLDERGQDAVEKGRDAELIEKLCDGAGHDGDRHNVEHRGDQKIVGGIHQGAHQIDRAHFVPKHSPKAEEQKQKDKGLHTDGFFDKGSFRKSCLIRFHVGHNFLLANNNNWQYAEFIDRNPTGS